MPQQVKWVISHRTRGSTRLGVALQWHQDTRGAAMGLGHAGTLLVRDHKHRFSRPGAAHATRRASGDVAPADRARFLDVVDLISEGDTRVRVWAPSSIGAMLMRRSPPFQPRIRLSPPRRPHPQHAVVSGGGGGAHSAPRRAQRASRASRGLERRRRDAHVVVMPYKQSLYLLRIFITQLRCASTALLTRELSLGLPPSDSLARRASERVALCGGEWRHIDKTKSDHCAAGSGEGRLYGGAGC